MPQACASTGDKASGRHKVLAFVHRFQIIKERETLGEHTGFWSTGLSQNDGTGVMGMWSLGITAGAQGLKWELREGRLRAE